MTIINSKAYEAGKLAAPVPLSKMMDELVQLVAERNSDFEPVDYFPPHPRVESASSAYPPEWPTSSQVPGAIGFRARRSSGSGAPVDGWWLTVSPVRTLDDRS